MKACMIFEIRFKNAMLTLSYGPIRGGVIQVGFICVRGVGFVVWAWLKDVSGADGQGAVLICQA